LSAGSSAGGHQAGITERRSRNRGLGLDDFGAQGCLADVTGYISGNTERLFFMTSSVNKHVAEHRRRLKQRGLVRIEVRAPKEDAGLLRDIAGALADPARAVQTRRLLHEHFNPYAGMSFKELLAAAPLEGVDLERSRDAARDIDFDE